MYTLVCDYMHTNMDTHTNIIEYMYHVFMIKCTVPSDWKCAYTLTSYSIIF